MKRMFLRSTALVVLLALCMAPAALAQNQQPQQAPDVDVDDEEIERIAQVYVEIEEVRQSYQPQFQETEDPEEAQALQQELQQEINQVIEDTEGLTVERYDTVIQAAQADDELYNKLIAAIEEASNEDGDG